MVVWGELWEIVGAVFFPAATFKHNHPQSVSVDGFSLNDFGDFLQRPSFSTEIPSKVDIDTSRSFCLG